MSTPTQTNPKLQAPRRTRPLVALLAAGSFVFLIVGLLVWVSRLYRDDVPESAGVYVDRGPDPTPAPPKPTLPPRPANPLPVPATIRMRVQLATVPPPPVNLVTATADIPADPAGLAAAMPASESALREFIVQWEQTLAQTGKNSLEPAPPQLTEALGRTQLSFATLQQLASSIGFVAGEKSAAPFHGAMVMQAEKQLAGKQTSDLPPADRAVVGALWRMGEPLLNSGADYASSARLFRLLGQLEPKGSADARRALWFYAEALDRAPDGKAAEAVGPLKKILAPDVQMPEEERLKFHLALGRALFAQGKYAEAVPELKAMVSGCGAFMDPDHAYVTGYWEAGHVMLVRAAARAGQAEEAQAAYEKWKSTYPDAAEGPLAKELAAEISRPATQPAR